MKTILGVLYLVIGVLVATQKDYLANLDGLADIVNLLLAVLLWPLVLLGVKFNIDFGDDGGKNGAKNAILVAGMAVERVRSSARALVRSVARTG